MSILAPLPEKEGQGTTPPVIQLLLNRAALLRASCCMYRDLTHIFYNLERRKPSNKWTLSSTYSYLAHYFNSFMKSLNVFLSTHEILAPYRTSTHIYTEIPHIFSPTLTPVYCNTLGYLPMGYANGALKRSITTALPPTFIPFFQSLLYRALNHRRTAPLPTFLGRDTVIRPTKGRTNLLSSLKFSMCKVVFKIDLKKTTSVMMSFLISSSRKLLT